MKLDLFHSRKDDQDCFELDCPRYTRYKKYYEQHCNKVDCFGEIIMQGPCEENYCQPNFIFKSAVGKGDLMFDYGWKRQ